MSKFKERRKPLKFLRFYKKFLVIDRQLKLRLFYYSFVFTKHLLIIKHFKVKIPTENNKMKLKKKVILYKILRMLKIASSFIKINNFLRFPLWPSIKFNFSSVDQSKITE